MRVYFPSGLPHFRLPFCTCLVVVESASDTGAHNFFFRQPIFRQPFLEKDTSFVENTFFGCRKCTQLENVFFDSATTFLSTFLHMLGGCRKNSQHRARFFSATNFSATILERGRRSYFFDR